VRRKQLLGDRKAFGHFLDLAGGLPAALWLAEAAKLHTASFDLGRMRVSNCIGS
jgi:hypothetical protein